MPYPGSVCFQDLWDRRGEVGSKIWQNQKTFTPIQGKLRSEDIQLMLSASVSAAAHL